MPDLNRDEPYEITREVVWLDPEKLMNPSYFTHSKIRPSTLDDMFDIPGVVALTTDLTLTQGRLRHDLKTAVWLRDAEGHITEMNPASAPIELLRTLANYMIDTEQVDPLEVASRSLDADVCIYYRVTYLANCTVVSWDDMSLALDEIVGTDPDDIDYGPSLTDLFGVAYAVEPASNHEKLRIAPLILEDLRTHTDLINMDCGYKFFASDTLKGA